MTGRTAARGYGWRHQQKRAEAAKAVATGAVHCTRCHKLIDPWQKWDLDHVDGIDKRLGVYRGPSHRSCNRAGKRRRRQQPKPSKPPAALSFFDVHKTR